MTSDEAKTRAGPGSIERGLPSLGEKRTGDLLTQATQSLLPAKWSNRKPSFRVYRVVFNISVRDGTLSLENSVLLAELMHQNVRTAADYEVRLRHAKTWEEKVTVSTEYETETPDEGAVNEDSEETEEAATPAEATPAVPEPAAATVIPAAPATGGKRKRKAKKSDDDDDEQLLGELPEGGGGE